MGSAAPCRRDSVRPHDGAADTQVASKARALSAITSHAPASKRTSLSTSRPAPERKSARGQNHRRDQYRYGAPAWREVRVDDWAARGYAPRERDYQRGAYGRGGFTPNFW